MTKLKQVEEYFQRYLFNGDQHIQQMIVSTEKVPAETRLAIYRHAYQARLSDALANNYPMLSAYLGTDYFDSMANEYIDKHPSLYRSIRWYGDQLTSFLRTHLDWNDHPYLAEMAQLEWQMALVFDAPDHSAIQLNDMACIPPEKWVDMRLKLHPTIHRVNCIWNVVDIWQALAEEQTPPEPVKQRHSVAWVLWRKELSPRYRSLTVDEAWAVDGLLKGLSFGDICEGLCEWVSEQEAGMHAASLLKTWIEAGLIAEVSY